MNSSAFDVEYLVVHQSVSPNSITDDRYDTAADIHLWHRRRGWSGCGYHSVILEDGIEEKGRPEYWQGAHCPPYNDCSLGVVLIGEGEFHDEQMETLIEVLMDWKSRYPAAKVVGHRDINQKTSCPGFDVIPWWEEVLRTY